MSNVSKVVVVTSGKGGVGKTTTSANIATGITVFGLAAIAGGLLLAGGGALLGARAAGQRGRLRRKRNRR